MTGELRHLAGAGSVEVAGLRVTFGRQPALAGVSFVAGRGEFVLLTGPSGSGKSTLLRCLNGLIPHAVPAAFSGRVLVGGLDTREHDVPGLARKVGFVFQNPETQLFNLTVHDEVRFAPRNAGLAESQVEAQARWALAAAGIAHLESRPVAALSGGEKQLVAIASVLALRPSILVLDEPTAHLDVPGARAVLNTLDGLRREEGTTIVLGEHRTGTPGRHADRLLVLDDGRVVADGPVRAVLQERDLVYRLGIRRPADEPEQPWEELIGEPVGSPAQAPLAALDGVEAGYGKHIALRGVDLAIYPGEVVALVGDNGAGKTTVVRLLAGLLSPRRGRVFVGGRAPRPGADGVGIVLQNPLCQLFCDTVEEEVAFGPSNMGRPDPSLVEEVLAAGDLLPLRRRQVSRLSCGQQQRTVVASALALRPQLLILDEPTMGQDWAHLAALMSHLRCLTREGCAVLLVTHDYKLVHRYAQRVVLLRGGRVAAAGRLRDGRRCERAQTPAASVGPPAGAFAQTAAILQREVCK